MAKSFESAIVRVHASDGTVVGAGFLVTDRHVLTCAHVVASALGLPEDTPALPQVELHLDFPLLTPNQVVTARVVHWRPDTDVAGLELTSEPPPEASAIRLVTADDLWGHSFRAFGFPAGYEQGGWASGVLRGRQADGWLQIEDPKMTGYLIAPGFSGSPVWDDVLEGVVGMIVAADTSERVKAAFLIPADVLAQAWPERVRVYHEPPVSALAADEQPRAAQSGGVTIGNVSGGIHGSIIAGGDVTTAISPGKQPAAISTEPSVGQARLITLRQILTQRFDDGGLRTLCFDLGVDYDSLPGQGKADKARELVAYFDRRRQIYRLIEVGTQQRPDIDWGENVEVTGGVPPKPSAELQKPEESIPGQSRFDDMLRQVTKFDLRLRRSMPKVTSGYAQAKDRDEIDRVLASIGEDCEAYNLWWTTGDEHYLAYPMRRLSDEIWLIDAWECKVDDLWVYRDTTLERQYVLVHLAARPPFGVHGHIPPDLKWEEAGYFDGQYVTRAEFDNGYAMIQGKIVELTGAELRIRNLRDDFFILAPQLSVYVYAIPETERQIRAVHQSLIVAGRVSRRALKPLVYLKREWY